MTAVENFEEFLGYAKTSGRIPHRLVRDARARGPRILRCAPGLALRLGHVARGLADAAADLLRPGRVARVCVFRVEADLRAVFVRAAARARLAVQVRRAHVKLVASVGHNDRLHDGRRGVDAPGGDVAVLLGVRVGGLEVALACAVVPVVAALAPLVAAPGHSVVVIIARLRRTPVLLLGARPPVRRRRPRVRALEEPGVVGDLVRARRLVVVKVEVVACKVRVPVARVDVRRRRRLAVPRRLGFRPYRAGRIPDAPDVVAQRLDPDAVRPLAAAAGSGAEDARVRAAPRGPALFLGVLVGVGARPRDAGAVDDAVLLAVLLAAGLVRVPDARVQRIAVALTLVLREPVLVPEDRNGSSGPRRPARAHARSTPEAF